jgi:DNA-cytosine methyltransferase
MKYLQDSTYSDKLSKSFVKKLTGCYYTSEVVARQGIKNLILQILKTDYSRKEITIIDPFAGDGRLIYWFIQDWRRFGGADIKWKVFLWDMNLEGLTTAEYKMQCLKNQNFDIEYQCVMGDSFVFSLAAPNFFDIIVTNPPWEVIKPESKELEILDYEQKNTYLNLLRKYDDWLKISYPLSQPIKKFAGWGTNLSRVGLEASLNICCDGGWIMILLPASFFADEQSKMLRRSTFVYHDILNISYYPSEAKLFEKADTSSSILICRKSIVSKSKIDFCLFDKNLKIISQDLLEPHKLLVDKTDFIIPISLGPLCISVIAKITAHLPTWASIEKEECEFFWAGREMDETRIDNFLIHDVEGIRFIKGKMIGRYEIKTPLTQSINKDKWIPPFSTKMDKIVWRDVSRPSQKRRLIATIAPLGVVAGNSLGVACYKDGDTNALKILLGILNSLCFEFQLRAYLATSHISLSAMRKVCMPSRQDFFKYSDILCLVEDILEGDTEALLKIESMVAKYVYKLNEQDFLIVLDSFNMLTKIEKTLMMAHFTELPENNTEKSEKIPNHLTSKLSELDLLVVNSVPPGGNWKHLPNDIPSNRVKQIRDSFSQGKGSRSTYYGRLLPDKPSYTINTYFNRPGNGCHIHYSQERVLSQREAARLQSFPDSFVFYGSQSSVNNQIGNAVPPLLAYQIAKQITKAIDGKGIFIDLFSGAGGLGLGFKWAGWQPIVANDIDPKFLETYSNNVHSEIIAGSITKPEIFNELVKKAKEAKFNNPDMPFWVLGGPPCQGFSTAGNKRTMEDERNTLFMNYIAFLEEIKPDGFLFENVAGLLNIEQGKVFENIQIAFKTVMPNMNGFVLNSENFAIPQRRKRVFLIGQKDMKTHVSVPKQLTALRDTKNLFETYHPCISVEDALSDLPELTHGQNGSCLDYLNEAETPYQMLMRGLLSPKEYLNAFKEQKVTYQLEMAL